MRSILFICSMLIFRLHTFLHTSKSSQNCKYPPTSYIQMLLPLIMWLTIKCVYFLGHQQHPRRSLLVSLVGGYMELFKFVKTPYQTLTFGKHFGNCYPVYSILVNLKRLNTFLLYKHCFTTPPANTYFYPLFLRDEANIL